MGVELDGAKIVANIDYLMKKLGYNREQLEHSAGFARGFLAVVESEVGCIDYEDVEIFANVLEEDVDVLLCDDASKVSAGARYLLPFIGSVLSDIMDGGEFERIPLSVLTGTIPAWQGIPDYSLITYCGSVENGDSVYKPLFDSRTSARNTKIAGDCYRISVSDHNTSCWLYIMNIFRKGKQGPIYCGNEDDTLLEVWMTDDCGNRQFLCSAVASSGLLSKRVELLYSELEKRKASKNLIGSPFSDVINYYRSQVFDQEDNSDEELETSSDNSWGEGGYDSKYDDIPF